MANYTIGDTQVFDFWFSRQANGAYAPYDPEVVLISLLVALVAGFVVMQYNALVRLNVAVDEAFAQIEVQLQRRSDLIPNLVETVKGYAAHEEGVFKDIADARSKLLATASSHASVAAAVFRMRQASASVGWSLLMIPSPRQAAGRKYSSKTL